MLVGEELLNWVEDITLQLKYIKNIFKFILEDIVCQNRSVGRMKTDHRELKA
jgi:hypothetical protein